MQDRKAIWPKEIVFYNATLLDFLFESGEDAIAFQNLMKALCEAFKVKDFYNEIVLYKANAISDRAYPPYIIRIPKYTFFEEFLYWIWECPKRSVEAKMAAAPFIDFFREMPKSVADLNPKIYAELPPAEKKEVIQAYWKYRIPRKGKHEPDKELFIFLDGRESEEKWIGPDTQLPLLLGFDLKPGQYPSFPGITYWAVADGTHFFRLTQEKYQSIRKFFPHWPTYEAIPDNTRTTKPAVPTFSKKKVGEKVAEFKLDEDLRRQLKEIAEKCITHPWIIHGYSFFLFYVAGKRSPFDNSLVPDTVAFILEKAKKYFDLEEKEDNKQLVLKERSRPDSDLEKDMIEILEKLNASRCFSCFRDKDTTAQYESFKTTLQPHI